MFAGVIVLAVALPVALNQKSWPGMFLALPIAAFGVCLPLFVFLFSGGLVPDWKGGCHNGWIDCFYMGKLALTPFVLWATVALFYVEGGWVKGPVPAWVGPGLFMGAVISVVCLLFGIATTGLNAQGPLVWWLLVPGYIAAWYYLRAAKYAGANGGWKNCWKALGWSMPFWCLGVIWSRHIYFTLPDQPPSCFVVTAAARGHAEVVGPFVETNHGGRVRRANLQLVTLWQFEALWRDRAPRGHRLFRGIYNRVGPVIAARIKQPWLADAVFMAIKPAELAAKFLLIVNQKKSEEKL